jgi:hypothetical protein
VQRAAAETHHTTEARCREPALHHSAAAETHTTASEQEPHRDASSEEHVGAHQATRFHWAAQGTHEMVSGQEPHQGAPSSTRRRVWTRTHHRTPAGARRRAPTAAHRRAGAHHRSPTGTHRRTPSGARHRRAFAVFRSKPRLQDHHDGEEVQPRKPAPGKEAAQQPQ